MTTVAVLQPGYLPWLGYFEQMSIADVFVLYDDVQYTKHAWQNRNRVKTKEGYQWLTVPILTRGMNDERIIDARIDGSQLWAKKHLACLRTYYGRTPYFQQIFPALEGFLLQPWEQIAELDEHLIRFFAGILGIKTPLYRSSELNIFGGQSSRLLNICQHFGATRYYSGLAAQTYLDVDIFRAANIEVEFQTYRHPIYRQQHGPFLSHLSIVDLLFNEGPNSLNVLLSSRANVISHLELS